MTDTNPDCFLASTEGFLARMPRAVHRLRRIGGRPGDDYLLVRVDPPIDAEDFEWGKAPIERVVLATRLMGDSLHPTTRWPLDVHVMRW